MRTTSARLALSALLMLITCASCGPSTKAGSIHDPLSLQEMNEYGEAGAIIDYYGIDRSLKQAKSWSYLVKEDSTSWWQMDNNSLLLTTVSSADLIRITHTSYASVSTGLIVGASIGLPGGITLAVLNSHEEDTFPIVFSTTFFGALLGMLLGLVMPYDWSFQLQ